MRETADLVRGFVLSLGLTGFAAVALAEEVNFFGDGIDYWKEKEKPVQAEPVTSATQTPVKANVAPQTNAPDGSLDAKTSEPEKFDWRPFLDAKNKEFFREGDYTPPEPFMEIVRNPSDANLRMWFSYIERKNALTQRLAERMDEYVKKNGGSLSQQAKARVQEVASALPRADPRDYRSLRFRMYFDSTCPHCKRMFATLNELQRRGYFVEARQVDQGAVQHLQSTVPIVQASREELRKFRVSSVPLILVGDLQHQSVYRQSGFMTTDEILSAIQAKAN